mmetsp:Transcript_18324/g.16201  ORF Transcript_18324/g.16201 Transcript_18324/m.16201 type:complete len:117 (-) Transcript_18324:110-460(-)
MLYPTKNLIYSNEWNFGKKLLKGKIDYLKELDQNSHPGYKRQKFEEEKDYFGRSDSNRTRIDENKSTIIDNKPSLKKFMKEDIKSSNSSTQYQPYNMKMEEPKGLVKLEIKKEEFI